MTIEFTTAEIRLGAYCRISQDSQGNEMGVTRQKSEMKGLAKRRDSVLLDENIFEDNNRSATNKRRRRPEFDRLLAKIESGEINRLMVWALDRLYRLPEDCIRLLNAADNAPPGFLIINTDGNTEIDPTSPFGRMTMIILSAIAENEIRVKNRRHQSAHTQRLENGAVPSNRGFGYAQSGAIIESEAVLVRRAFEMIATGNTINSVVGMLNDHGAVNTEGTPWNRSSVRPVLLNPRYAGWRARYIPAEPGRGPRHEIFVHQGERVRGQWEAIVTDEVFEQVTRILTDPARTAGQQNARKWLGTNFYLCGNCGGQMRTGSLSAQQFKKMTADERRRYSCNECHMSRGRTDEIDAEVAGQICSYLDSADLGSLLGQNDQATRMGTLIKERGELHAEIPGLRDKLKAATREGNITMVEIVTEWIAENNARLRQIDIALDSAASTSAVARLAGSLEPAKLWMSLPIAERAELASAVGLSVVLRRPKMGPQTKVDISSTLLVVPTAA